MITIKNTAWILITCLWAAGTLASLAQGFRGLPTEGPGAYASPNVRFEIAPAIGEPLPDVEVVDRGGNPVAVRGLAGENYTVLVLGCLT
jgi:hypothetical protein